MLKKLVVYGIPASPPVRSVRTLLKALDLDSDFKIVNTFEKQNHSEEYLKINPNHKIPSLDDNGFIVWDSHAIMIYLMEKYGKNDLLYPKELQKRTLIHQLLFCDTELFMTLRAMLNPMFVGNTESSADKIEAIVDSCKSLEKLLEGKTYFAGNTVTICDISLLSTLTAIDVAFPINPKTYPNIKAWMTRMENIDYVANVSGKKEITELINKLFKRQ